MGHNRQQLGACLVQGGKRGQLRFRLGLDAALLDDAREQRGNRLQEAHVLGRERPRLGRLDVENADQAVVPRQRNGEHRRQTRHVEAGNPLEVGIDANVGDLDWTSLGCGQPGDALADAEVDTADLVAVQAVRGGKRQAGAVPVEKVEGADLDPQGQRGPIHERAHEIVPVASACSELCELLEQGQLAQLPLGVGALLRRFRSGAVPLRFRPRARHGGAPAWPWRRRRAVSQRRLAGVHRDQ